MLCIQNATLYTPDERIDDANVIVEAGRIARVSTGAGASAPTDCPPDATVIDARGLVLAPGFIDLQFNGGFGDDFTARPKTIWRVAAQLPRFGVTSFLPTIVTSPLAKVRAAQREVTSNRPRGFVGATPLGVHAEGPFLNPRKKGAHNPNYLRLPDPRLVREWSPANGVRLVTLAPELPGALGVIEQLASRGVVVSAGHTMATFEQAEAGFAAGLRYATHLFNAMPPMEHRNPSIPGAVLMKPAWFTGLIADGVHVHPALVKLVWHSKGSRALNVVSDAMAAMGVKPGVYRLNDFDVYVTETEARLKNRTLAGSVLPLDRALKNIIAFVGCTLPHALATMTTTAANVLGIAHERGRIAPGLIADLVLLTPELDVVMTIAAGEIAYRRAA